MVKRIFILLFTLLTTSLYAGYPGIHWREIDSEHFRIIFPEGREVYAYIVSRVAERAYPVYQREYNATHSQKTTITLWDIGETNNGATYYFWNFIRIDGYRGFFYLRDTAPWWKNVISHEYSHDISLLAATPTSKRLPGFFTGFNTSDISGDYAGQLYVPTTNIPRWLAEGIAQYNAIQMGGDRWDSIRDMLLRGMILSGNNLTNDQLGTIRDKGFLEGEMVYNQGLALTLYLNEKYPGIVTRITGITGKKWHSGFEPAFKKVTGLDWNTFFDRWLSDTTEKYERQIRNIIPETGHSVSPTYTIIGKIMPGRDKLLFIASQQYPPGDLYSGRPTEETEKIAEEVWSFATRHGGILYASGKRDWKGYSYSRLFYTHGDKTRKVDTPVRFYALTSTSDGFAGIGWLKEGMVLCSIKLDPDTISCRKLPVDDVLSITYGAGNLYMVVAIGGEPKILMEKEKRFYVLPLKGYFRDVSYSNGKLYFSWDRGGIYNIYSYDTVTGRIDQLTRTVTGAFSPAITGNTLYHVEFTGDGFQIYKMPITTLKRLESVRWQPYSFPSTHQVTRGSKRARNTFLPPLFFPEIVYSFGKLKLGGTIITKNVLENINLESEFLLGRDIDFSLKASFDFTIPTLYINTYYYRRNREYNYDFFTIETRRHIYIVESGFKYYYRYPFYLQGYTYYRAIKTDYIGASYTDMETLEGGIIFAYVRGDTEEMANPRDGLTVSTILSAGSSRLPGGVIKRDRYNFTKTRGTLSLFLPTPLRSAVFSRSEAGYIDRNVETYDYFFLGSWISYLSEGEYNIEETFPGYDIMVARWYFAQRIGTRIPLWEGEKRLGIVTFKGAYLSFFSDFGIVKRISYDMKDNEIVKYAQIEKPYDFGAELRMKNYLFYSNAWNSFVKIAYSPEIKQLKLYFALGIGF